MRKQAHQALSLYNIDTDHPSQIISFTAPTGAGKTIIMSGLLENIYFGDDILPARPDAITVWLSDDPNLNEQSKEKIETRADKFTPGQCVTISEDSFDCEVLEDGKIYFLNTQKLSEVSETQSCVSETSGVPDSAAKPLPEPAEYAIGQGGKHRPGCVDQHVLF